jgi:Heterokaryon incompatibility protein (HET)
MHCHLIPTEYPVITSAEPQEMAIASASFPEPSESAEDPSQLVFRSADAVAPCESLDLISAWTQACDRNHTGCAQTKRRLPTRVLDIGSEGIKLVSGMGAYDLYAAVSHCWGSAETLPARTTKANLASRHLRINEDELSRTFRDAILLARHLSIRYLWIDSLCIIQDNTEDWARESANMASIYEDAWLVIAATHAEHGGIGCFSSRNDKTTLRSGIPQLNDPTAGMYIQNRGDHLHFDPMAAYNANPDQRYPLLSRAWCFQERLLATRVLHFTRDELIWECRTTTRCECGSLERSEGIRGAFKTRWAVNRELGELFDLWHKTLRLYSKLRVTYGSDRLPALSGLAKKLQSRGCGEYAAGVWAKNIFADLMWCSETRGTRPEEWRAPSWSWASGDGFHLYFTTQNDNSPEDLLDVENLRGPHHPSKTHGGEPFRTAVVSLDYELKGLDRTGEVKEATLTISAPAINLSLRMDSQQWKLQKDKKELAAHRIDCPHDVGEHEISLLCVWVGTIRNRKGGIRPQFLLLQPSRGLGAKAAAPGCYERVGMLDVGGWRYSEEDLSTILAWFEDAEINCIKIV